MWLRKEVSNGKNDYLLRVARNVDYINNLEPDRIILNIKALGGAGAMNVFGLQKVSRERVVPEYFVKPQDILNMNIKQNPRK